MLDRVVDQCRRLTQKHHIYLLENGRMSMSGINTKNVDHVARGIRDVVTATTNS